MKRFLPILAAIAVPLGLTAPAAVAANASYETGFHSMHALKRVGGKLCMASHTHAGESIPTGTKEVAIKLAINNWQAFTSDEYGKAWGSYSNAWAQKTNCKGGPGKWVCEVTARPCRIR